MRHFLHVLVPILWVVLSLGGSILFHELGHYVSARRRNMIVPKFSIGFGPKLFGFRRGGTEFLISLFPLGGYASVPQIADLKEIEGEFDLPKDLKPATCFEKVCVAFAGPFANLLLAFVLAIAMYFVGLPVPEESLETHVGHVARTLELADGLEITSPAYKAKILPGDRIISIDGNGVKKFDEIYQFIALGTKKNSQHVPYSTIELERDGQILSLTVNPVVVSLSGQKDDAMRTIGIYPKQTLIVDRIVEFGSSKRMLEEGDRIVSANGGPVFSAAALHALARKNDTISMVVERRGERRNLRVPVTRVAVERPFLTFTFSDGSAILDVIPLEKFPREFNGEVSEFSDFQIFTNDTRFLKKNGISNGAKIVSMNGIEVNSLPMIRDIVTANSRTEMVLLEKFRERTIHLDRISGVNLVDAKFDSFLGIKFRQKTVISHPTPLRQMVDSIDMTARTLRGLFHRDSDISPKHLMGPVGLINTLHSFAKGDLRWMLWFLILINVNLAILNLLPFPILDGGIIAIALIERVTHLRCVGKIFSKIQSVFFALLIGFIIYLTFFDLRRMWGENHLSFERQRQARLLMRWE